MYFAFFKNSLIYWRTIIYLILSNIIFIYLILSNDYHISDRDYLDGKQHKLHFYVIINSAAVLYIDVSGFMLLSSNGFSCCTLLQISVISSNLQGILNQILYSIHWGIFFILLSMPQGNFVSVNSPLLIYPWEVAFLFLSMNQAILLVRLKLCWLQSLQKGKTSHHLNTKVGILVWY